MYCIKCGVELADTEKKCPLCQTVVFHPDLLRPEGEPFYPQDRYPVPPGRSLLLPALLTGAVLLPLLIVLICDQQLNGTVTWSGYVIGGIVLAYVGTVLPMWFQRPNPVIFVPCFFGALEIYLLYISLASGGNWFLSFAFPVAGGIGLIVTAVVVLLRYLPKGTLYILGGAGIALGGFLLLSEFLLTATFDTVVFTGWSLYPLVILALLGGFLIFLAICRPAREMMARKFFI